MFDRPAKDPKEKDDDIERVLDAAIAKAGLHHQSAIDAIRQHDHAVCARVWDNLPNSAQSVYTRSILGMATMVHNIEIERERRANAVPEEVNHEGAA